MDIGNKLRELRKRKGLTLEELALRCELTKGFLSQVERNLTSPSIQTLDDILEALGVDLKTFFNDETDNRIIFKRDDYYQNKQDDKIVSFIVPNAQKNIMEPILLELEEKGTSDICTPFDGEEFIYVLSGSVELFYNNQKYKIREGETAYFSSKHEHFIKNNGKDIAKLIWIISPPNF